MRLGSAVLACAVMALAAAAPIVAQESGEKAKARAKAQATLLLMERSPVPAPVPAPPATSGLPAKEERKLFASDLKQAKEAAAAEGKPVLVWVGWRDERLAAELADVVVHVQLAAWNGDRTKRLVFPGDGHDWVFRWAFDAQRIRAFLEREVRSQGSGAAAPHLAASIRC